MMNIDGYTSPSPFLRILILKSNMIQNVLSVMKKKEDGSWISKDTTIIILIVAIILAITIGFAISLF